MDRLRLPLSERGFWDRGSQPFGLQVRRVREVAYRKIARLENIRIGRFTGTMNTGISLTLFINLSNDAYLLHKFKTMFRAIFGNV
jgi:hypothetical protein